MKNNCLIKTLALFSGLCGLSSQAASVSPAERDVIQQQQRDILEQNRQQREDLQRTAKPAVSPGAPRSAGGAVTAGPCFTLNNIELDGADNMPAGVKRRIIGPYLGQCNDLAHINALVKQVSDWYIEQGYITSRAFLTAQDLSQGTLRLTIMEGKLQDILLEHHDARLLRAAFPHLKGSILNLRDIEQGMEQINRLRREPVQIEILPGSQPGYSIVNLTATPEFPLNLSAGFDNSGQKSTGTGQINASLTANNVLGMADQWYVGGAHSSAYADDRQSRSLQTGVSLPYGYWLLDYSYSYSDYLSTLTQQGFDWRSTGDSQAHRLTLSRVISRNADMKTGLSLGLTHRISRNLLNDIRLQSSSRKLTSVTGALTHSRKLWGGFATLSPSYSRGVPWLGAENDRHKQPDAPRAEFSKWGLSGSFYRPLTQRLTYLTSLSGQWTGDRLYGSERMTLGGDSSVRGFKEQYLAGDNGGYWRNELDQRLVTLPALGDISGLVALDGGYLHHDHQDVNAGGALWGAAVGLSSANRVFTSQFTVGWPLSYPRQLAPDRVSVYYHVGVAL